ncbi:MAG: glycosyltransferase [Candidatus Omnitrophica bacterium]|nr:glycosyltransferase [Candidatus Omnitrophota bacterium]MDD5671482.1 glycosyltransferase [Candidatus Omnitrophota bacterium]
MNGIYLSVVIPAYNEEKRLPQTLGEVRSYLDSTGYPYEVLIVDDGSTDKTLEVCREAEASWAELKIIARAHEGKGASVKQGCLTAVGEFILVMDADHATPIDTLDFMMPVMKNSDMVVGVRTFCGEEGSSGRMRRIVGLAQQLLAHIIVFQTSVADSQCGYKLFTRKAAHKIFSRLRVKGGMYDCEIFLIAHKHKLRIYSKPVKWVNKAGSTINLIRCIICDPWDLICIRLMDWLGQYN